jgi:hypothetical protein
MVKIGHVWLHIHNIMCVGHNYDNMEEIAIQLSWTSQG